MFKNKLFANILLGLYFAALLVHIFIANIIYILFAIGTLTGFSVSNKLTEKNKLHLVLILIAVTFSLALGFIRDYQDNTALLLIPAYFIALNLFYKYIHRSFFLILFYSFVGITVYNFFFLGIPFNEMLSHSSRNAISVILLFSLSTHYIYNIYSENKISSFHSIILLALAFLAVSRAGIVTSAMLVIVVSIYNNNFKQIVFSLLIVIIPIFIYWGAINDYLLSSKAYMGYLEEGLESIARKQLFFGYFNKLNLLTFFSGVSLDQQPFLKWNHNPHNSLLNAHSLFGLMSFWLFYVFYKIFKKINIIAFIFGIVLIRSLTDTVLFVSVFDYIWILVYLISIQFDEQV